MDEKKEKGMVYLVGAGPGDPGLMTLRGAECLRRADCVVYDYLVHPRLVSLAPPGSERIYVGKKAGAHTLKQEAINALLVEKCLEGKRVVRLKGGDPFVFGRGGEEALALREAGCHFEIVPGVTSGVAAAAYAGIPVTHRGLTSTLAFVTGHEKPDKQSSDINWPSLAGMGTVVFYMGVGNLPMIAAQMIANGRDPATPAAVIRWGTWPQQQTVCGTLADIAEKTAEAGMKPPALIVVGEVVALRGSLSWLEARPLFGRRIVVTRSRAQASDLSARLEALGAEVIEFPVIRIIPPENLEALRAAVRRAAGQGASGPQTGRYDWIIFTSVNGVDAFFETLSAENLDARALGKTRICAIGPATAERLRACGLRADLLPPKYVAESVAEVFSQQETLEGKQMLLPRADIARGFLREALEKMGARVEEVAAYQTVLEEPDHVEAVRAGILSGETESAVFAVTFTSSSTVRNFAKLAGEDTLRNAAPSVHFVSIGPETTKTLRAFTGAPVLETEEYTIEGLINALLSIEPAKDNPQR